MTDETTTEETQEERYARQERERQEKYEAERAADREKFDEIERLIGPNLKFKPYDRNHSKSNEDPWWNYCSREIQTAGGERVGHVRLDASGYSYNRKKYWSVTSPRILKHGYYNRRADGTRRYKYPHTAAEAIKKFCIPVSDDEQRAEVLRRELQHYRNVVDRAYKRSISIDGQGYGSTIPVDRFVRLLASDIAQDRLEGEEYMRILIRKKRVHNRWSAWVKATFIDPRVEELDGLDTSKEKITT